MADLQLARGGKAGAEVVQVVAVGARGDRPVGQPPDRRVEVQLAEIAPVQRVGAVAWVAELARVHDPQVPAFLPGVAAYAACRLGGHGGRDGVDHGGPGAALRDMGQGHAVHPAADGDGQRVVA